MLSKFQKSKHKNGSWEWYIIAMILRKSIFTVVAAQDGASFHCFIFFMGHKINLRGCKSLRKSLFIFWTQVVNIISEILNDFTSLGIRQFLKWKYQLCLDRKTFESGTRAGLGNNYTRPGSAIWLFKNVLYLISCHAVFSTFFSIDFFQRNCSCICINK